MTTVKIATRQSDLALWQANHVRQLIESANPAVSCEIVGMTTLGDRNKVTPLGQMGGKGVFVKELETALLDGSVDIAVHSMKDVPGELPDGLDIAAMTPRADPRDAFISNDYACLDDLPAGALIGSSSLRRVLQLQHAFPALRFEDLRGNVPTRLNRLDDRQYDAIILAVAGLTRLGLFDRVTQAIDEQVCLPAAGQGAVGVECRVGDEPIRSILQTINDASTFKRVSAERRVTLKLGATCNLPVAVFANFSGDTENNDTITIRAFVADLSGSEAIAQEITGNAVDANALGDELGERLMSLGAGRLMGLN